MLYQQGAGFMSLLLLNRTEDNLGRGPRTVSGAETSLGLFFLLLWGCLLAIPADASRLLPPQPESWNTFRVEAAEGNLCRLRFDFVPDSRTENPPVSPAGLIGGVQAPGDSYVACRWQTGVPDRDDEFSVRWKGEWRPGSVTCELRLRADEEATLILDGTRVLVSKGEVPGVTGTLSLDSRNHSLRLDYREGKGLAHVFLEWRLPGEVWKPLILQDAEDEKERSGWQATYFLGRNFESETFQRTDPVIAFDWGARGPFDRPEDLPSATLEWANENAEGFFGRLTTTRDGILSIGLLPSDFPESNLTVESTQVVLGASDGQRLLALHFDRPSLSDLAPGPPRQATGETVLGFPLDAGEALRFWGEESAVRNSAAVDRRLDRAKEAFDRSRPHLERGLSPWDASVLVEGRLWFRILLDRMKSPPVEDSISKSSSAAANRQSYDDRLAADLPSAVSSMLSIWAPDLFFVSSGCLENLPLRWTEQVFARSSTSELERLTAALTHWRSTYESARGGNSVPLPRAGSGPPFSLDSSDPRWPTRSLADGLAEALRGVSALNGLLFPNPAVGTNLGNRYIGSGDFAIRNWRSGHGVYSLSISPRETMLAESGGPFLRCGCPALFSGFRVGKNGNWKTEVGMNARCSLEAGPVDRIGGALWDEGPLLLTQQGNQLFSGKLPRESGKLELVIVDESLRIPVR